MAKSYKKTLSFPKEDTFARRDARRHARHEARRLLTCGVEPAGKEGYVVSPAHWSEVGGRIDSVTREELFHGAFSMDNPFWRRALCK
jgi:hypothetical protein